MSDLRDDIKAFIVENFLFGDDIVIEDTTSFMEDGIIDSTGVLELIDFLEEKYSVTIEDDEMIPENLDSVTNVVAYLERKMQ